MRRKKPPETVRKRRIIDCTNNAFVEFHIIFLRLRPGLKLKSPQPVDEEVAEEEREVSAE